MKHRIALSISDHSYPFGEAAADLVIPVAKRKKCGIEIRDMDNNRLRSFNPRAFKTVRNLKAAILGFAA